LRGSRTGLQPLYLGVAVVSRLPRRIS
jgi:hypothetical protein